MASIVLVLGTISPAQQGSKGAGGGGDLPVGEFMVKRVIYSSTQSVLTNITSTFEAEGGSIYSPTGWEINGSGQSIANPISYTKGQTPSLTVNHFVAPEDLTYTISYYPGNLSFVKRNLTSAAAWVDTNITSANALYSKIYYFAYKSIWYCSGSGPIGNLTWDGMGQNNIYITWATPFGSEVTYKRLDWAVKAANGATTEEQGADKIYNALGEPNNPPYEKDEKPLEQGATWKLLDEQVSGECDEQATLMMKIMKILGIAAEVHLIRASTDSTNVEDLESSTTIFPGRTAYLIMDFVLGQGYDWNAFEGCCKCADKWYALFPKYKANTALDLYRAISFQQYWVLTYNDIEPTAPGWGVEMVLQEVPKQ